MPQLRLFVEASIEQARQSIEPDFSMRSSIGVMMSQNANSINHPFESSNTMSKQMRGISGDFEEISEIEQRLKPSKTMNAHSVGIGGEDMLCVNNMNNAATDVCNLVGFQNMAINTQAVNTDEK